MENVNRGQYRLSAAVPRDTLTKREKEIVVLVGHGFTNKDIGEFFGITVPTVKRHLSNIFDKFGCNSRLELTLRCKNSDLRNTRKT